MTIPECRDCGDMILDKPANGGRCWICAPRKERDDYRDALIEIERGRRLSADELRKMAFDARLPYLTYERTEA